MCIRLNAVQALLSLFVSQLCLLSMGSEAGAGHAVGGVECNASDESEDDESFVRMLAMNVAPRGGIVLG
eukprot:6198602-Pleurochrysis_carterae.AAC.1